MSGYNLPVICPPVLMPVQPPSQPQGLPRQGPRHSDMEMDGSTKGCSDQCSEHCEHEEGTRLRFLVLFFFLSFLPSFTCCVLFPFSHSSVLLSSAVFN